MALIACDGASTGDELRALERGLRSTGVRKPTAARAASRTEPAAGARCTLQHYGGGPRDRAQRLVVGVSGELPVTFREQLLEGGGAVLAMGIEGAQCGRAGDELGGFTLQRDATGSVVRVEVPAGSSATLVQLGAPPRFVLDLTRTDAREAGLVMLDPGHGGSDRGAHGAGGLDEAALALDVAQRAARWLTHYDPNLSAELTRDADVAEPLLARVARANARGAAAFVSIHVGLEGDPGGVATYVLDPATDPESEALVQRENAGAPGPLSAPVGAAALRTRAESARRLADSVHNRVYRGARNVAPGLANRGIRRGPLAVLVGAAMPAVLVEVGALAHGADAERLADARVRDAMAEGIARGLVRYLAGR